MKDAQQPFSRIVLLKLKDGTFSKLMDRKNETSHLEPLILLKHNQVIYIVKAIKNVNKCEQCRAFYVEKHQCNKLRLQYYYLRVSHVSKNWWKKIRFVPVGDVPDIKRVIVTYDIETYTKHGRYGKLLVPYLLVMTI